MAGKLAQALGKVLRKVTRKPPTPPPVARPTSRRSPLADVTVEYNPSLDGDADPGEVVWTWVPYEEDPSQGKDRPVVILGRRRRLLVAVALTSKRRDGDWQIPVGTGPWDRDGRPSYAKIDRVLDVDAAKVRREGSILDRRHFDQIITALQRNR